MNVFVKIISWAANMQRKVVEKRAMKKFKNDKVLQKSLSRLYDKLKDLGPDSPAMQRLKKL